MLLQVAVVASMAASALAQIPPMEVRTLSDKTVRLPDAVRDHVAVFVIGFTRGSQTPTSAWGKRLTQELSACDCLLFQAAVLQDVPRFFRGMVVSGIRRGVPSSQRDRFLLMYEKQDEWKNLVQYSDGDASYVVLFDTSGNAVWTTHRSVNDAGVAELRRHIAALKKQDKPPITSSRGSAVYTDCWSWLPTAGRRLLPANGFF